MLNKTLEYFRILSKIPRCSHNEGAVIEWIETWAKDNNFESKKDKTGNLLVIVPATRGMEGKECVVLQGHVDMVCVKTSDSNHDFSKDPIEIIEKDGFLVANNTTLGADNGIGVSMAMASVFLPEHPKLELLFTIVEEKGMLGALNLKKGFISGTKLINIDTELEGDITIGSAAGRRQLIKSEFNESISKLQSYKFNFSGLKGGHSGIEIHNSKGNINEILFLFLEFLGVDFELSFIKAGVADNAIPRNLETTLCLADIANLEEKITNFIKIIINEFDELNFSINYEKLNDNINTIGLVNSNKIKDAVLKSKSGVYRMSDEIEGFVISSQNMGILSLDEGNLKIEILSRSSLDKELDIIIEQNKIAFESFTDIELEKPNPSWLETKESKLPKEIKNIYEEFIGKEVKMVGVHAGLECGAIINVMPKGSEAVSIGPNIFGAHTYKEKCEIKSVGVVCDVLRGILKNF